MDHVATHFLEGLNPMSRPMVDHELELPGVLDDMRMQLFKHKVSLCFLVPA